MANSLRVVHWNAQSLTGKERLLRHFLGEQEVDVALISETHLRPTTSLKIPGYVIYRQDETAPNGSAYRGLAVLVKRRIVHQPIPYKPLDSIYALGIEVQVGGGDLRIFAAYRPPKTAFKVEEVRNLVLSPTPTLLAGDFNAKHPTWNSSLANTAGRALFNDSVDHDYDVIGPDEPTRYDPGDRSDSVLDIVVYRGLRNTPSQEVLVDLPSDHRPVLLVLDGLPTRVELKTPRPRVNWDAFSTALGEFTQRGPVTTADEVESTTRDITAAVQCALDTASHTVPASGRRKPLPARVQELIAEKRRTRKLWQTTRCPTLKTKVNTLVDRVKRELQDHAAESWETHLLSIGDDVPSVHRLCRQLSTVPEAVRPLVDAHGQPRYKAEDRAEIFAECLERQFTPNPASDVEHVSAVEQHLREYFEAPIGSEEDPVFFSPGQVQRAIRWMKPNKAPGADRITNMALRHLPQRSLAAVARLFNGILRSGHFPTTWKLGRVIMLPKPGKDKKKPESYRPITLLPTLSKVFERLLLNQLQPHITPRPEQFGFRAAHSTTLQLTRVLHFLTASQNKREFAVAVLLDMEKAFDRVWHEGLLYKLSTSSAPRRIVKVVASFLADRRFQVAVEDSLSAERRAIAGVPQGSVLSPACYSRYTDDIPVVGDAKLALFADDAAYYCASMNRRHAAAKLQLTLDALPSWLSKWRLSVNVGKTQALITGRHPSGYPPPLRLQGQDIAWLPKVKYLGVTIDQGLYMHHHVSEVVQRAKLARTLLRPVLTSSLPLRTKLGIYKTYIRSRLTYAAPAWYVLVAESQRRRLRTQETASLRAITCAPRFVRNTTIMRDLQLESLDAFIRRLARNMYDRADNSVHPHLQDIAPLHARPPDDARLLPLPRELLQADDTQESQVQ